MTYEEHLSDMLAIQLWRRKVLGAHAALFALAEDAASHWRGLSRPTVLWVDHDYAAARGVLVTVELRDGQGLKDVEPMLEAILDRGLLAEKTVEDVNDVWSWRQWPFVEKRRKLPEHPLNKWNGWGHPRLHVRASIRPGASCLVKVETSYQPGSGKLLCPGDPGYEEEVERLRPKNEPTLLDVDPGHPFVPPMNDTNEEEIPF